jgi:hypothetical protein
MKLSPQSKVLLEDLTVTQLLKKFCTIYGSKEPATGPYPEADESIPLLEPTYLIYFGFIIILCSNLYLCRPTYFDTSGLQTKILYIFLIAYYMPSPNPYFILHDLKSPVTFKLA